MFAIQIPTVVRVFSLSIEIFCRTWNKLKIITFFSRESVRPCVIPIDVAQRHLMRHTSDRRHTLDATTWEGNRKGKMTFTVDRLAKRDVINKCPLPPLRGKVIAESRQCHLKSNRDGYKNAPTPLYSGGLNTKLWKTKLWNTKCFEVRISNSLVL